MLSLGCRKLGIGYREDHKELLFILSIRLVWIPRSTFASKIRLFFQIVWVCLWGIWIPCRNSHGILTQNLVSSLCSFLSSAVLQEGLMGLGMKQVQQWKSRSSSDPGRGLHNQIHLTWKGGISNESATDRQLLPCFVRLAWKFLKHLAMSRFEVNQQT